MCHLWQKDNGLLTFTTCYELYICPAPLSSNQAFSKIAMDYIDQAESLKPFFSHSPNLQGIQQAIEARKQFVTNREMLVQELKKQYDSVKLLIK